MMVGIVASEYSFDRNRLIGSDRLEENGKKLNFGFYVPPTSFPEFCFPNSHDARRWGKKMGYLGRFTPKISPAEGDIIEICLKKNKSSGVYSIHFNFHCYRSDFGWKGNRWLRGESIIYVFDQKNRGDVWIDENTLQHLHAAILVSYLSRVDIVGPSRLLGAHF